MPTFECSILIRADRAAVFELTQDYARRLSWDPFLNVARLLGGATGPAVGVRAWCAAWYGLGMETEYVTFAPPGVAAVRMTRGPALLAAFAGTWRFEEAGPAVTRVVFRYHLKARPRWLRRILEPLLAVVFRRDTRLRLDALKRAAEALPAEQPAEHQARRGCRDH
jgi:Polyketide cyclase / dehydrase and lipid transport